jgi:hypothetical protein
LSMCESVCACLRINVCVCVLTCLSVCASVCVREFMCVCVCVRETRMKCRQTRNHNCGGSISSLRDGEEYTN